MTASARWRQVIGLAAGPLLAVVGTVGVVIVERRSGAFVMPWALMIVTGLVVYAVVSWRMGSELERSVPRVPPLLVRWSPALLAAVIVPVTLVGAFGFRACDDLPQAQRCLCYYVGAAKAPRWFPDPDARAVHHAALPSVCAADPALPDVLRTLSTPE